MAQRFAKALESYDREAVVQRKITEKMIDLLLPYRDEFDHILEIGCGTGLLSKKLYSEFAPLTLWLNDICTDLVDVIELTERPGVIFEAGDAEHTSLPAQQSLITSCSAIQWFKDPAAFFAHCSELLISDGVLAFSTFGPLNLREIKNLTGSGLHYPAVDELLKMIEQHFELLYVSEEQIEVNFHGARNVLKHLKETGVTGVSQVKWTPSKFTQFNKEYIRKYSKKGKLVLTYHPIYIVARNKKRM